MITYISNLADKIERFLEFKKPVYIKKVRPINNYILGV